MKVGEIVEAVLMVGIVLGATAMLAALLGMAWWAISGLIDGDIQWPIATGLVGAIVMGITVLLRSAVVGEGTSASGETCPVCDQTWPQPEVDGDA